MEEKGYLPEQVFNANKCPILGFFFFFKCLIRKEEKQAVGFKAERDRLTIANTVGFMIKTALVHWRRQWRPTPVLLPGKSHGQRSLAGCSPWGR